MNEGGILFQHGVLNGNQVMVDYLDDNLRRLNRLLAQVHERTLHWKPDPGANSMAVTIWHMGRLLDVFLTQQVKGESSANECWIRNGWAERTSYDPRGLGRDGWGSLNGYTPEDVARIPAFSKEQVLDYLDDVCSAVKTYIRKTPMADLAQAAPGLDGLYTKYQVVSMALLDNVRHLGEIYALKAMWDRANAGATE
jgi:hypothetical protein